MFLISHGLQLHPSTGTITSSNGKVYMYEIPRSYSPWNTDVNNEGYTNAKSQPKSKCHVQKHSAQRVKERP